MQTNWLAKVLLLAALLPCGVAGLTRAATPLPFTLVNDYLIVIPVTINGATPAQFLLDTGANTTLVTPEFAQRLGLRPVGRIELITVAGTQLLLQTQAETVAVGSHTVRGVEVLISDLPEVRRVAPQVSGVLGMNFLAQFNYLIDYNKRQLVLDEGETAYCGERLPLVLQDERWCVLTRAGARERRFVPDSGVNMLLLFTRGESANGFEFAPATPTSGQARTNAGSRAVTQRRLRSLQLGRARFTDVPVSLLPGVDRGEEGLLPTRLCQRIYFNHRQGYIILQPMSAYED